MASAQGRQVTGAGKVTQFDGFPHQHAAGHVRHAHMGIAALAFHADGPVSAGLELQHVSAAACAVHGLDFLQFPQQPFGDELIHYLHDGREAHVCFSGQLSPAELLALADQVKYHPAGISAARGGIDHDG